MTDISAFFKYFTLNTSSELVCLLVAITCLWRDKNTAWRSLILFLLITCITEFAGIYIKLHAKSYPDKINVSVYNIFTIFDFAFISFMFGDLLKNYIKSKPIVISGFILFLVVYISEMLILPSKQKTFVTTIVISLIFIFYSLFFYYHLLKSEVYINIKSFAPFWWVAGVLLFYFGTTSCNLFYKTLEPSKGTKEYFVHLHYIGLIYKALNVILYGCWSYSFICRRWLTKSKI